jgi:hypothetical protein
MNFNEQVCNYSRKNLLLFGVAVFASVAWRLQRALEPLWPAL